jgi:hypothetical protein
MPDAGVQVFFYGSFMNREVLARSQVTPEGLGAARLWGHDIRIAPLANLVRSDERCVYGTVCELTHAELDRLFGEARFGTYRPEAVLVETGSRGLVPALCYIAPAVAAQPPATDYLDRIVAAARQQRFPDWYVARLESFRAPSPDG